MATDLLNLAMLALVLVFCSGVSAEGVDMHDFKVTDPSADTGTVCNPYLQNTAQLITAIVVLCRYLQESWRHDTHINRD